MSVFLAGAFSVISSFASAAFFLSAAFGIVKTVLYFTKKDEQQAITAKSQLEWNTGFFFNSFRKYRLPTNKRT